MNGFGSDLRAALRALRARPALSAFTSFTLAIGLAAAATIFGLVDALVLRPLAFPDQDRLVMAWETSPGGEGYERFTVAPANFLDWRAASHQSLETLVALDGWQPAIRGRDVAEKVEALRVSAGFFETLGVVPRPGRAFLPEEAAGDGRRLVLGYALWQRAFAGEASVVGRSVIVDGELYVVVGIAPPGFSFPNGVEAWAPLPLLPGAAARDHHHLAVIGRLAPGRSRDQARAQLALVAERLQAEHPETNRARGVELVSLSEGMEDAGVRPILAIWQIAAVFLLLIACVNVANLVLARGAERQAELAVRQALGAGRGRLVRQLATEGLLLAVTATLLSLPLTALAARTLREHMPARIARFVTGWEQIGVGTPTLLFTAALAVLATAVFSAWPAWRSARADVVEALKQGGRSAGAGRRGQRGRSLLVVAEVAGALMLLAAAGVSVRGARALTQGPLGYDAEHLLTFELSLGARHADPEARRAFARDAAARLARVAGVRQIAYANVLPSTGNNASRAISVEGEPPPDASDPFRIDARWVSDDFHAVMGIPILAGRGFDAGDREDALPVAVVSRSMAERFWPGRDPLGRRFRVGGEQTPWVTVVGVSGDVVHHWFARRNYPTFYRPYAQEPSASLAFALRTEGDPETLALAARQAVREADPDLPAAEVRSMRRAIGDSTIGLQYGAAILAAFGVLALVLAASGVYGVMAYRVSLRRREFGVRLALGATAGDLVRLSLGQALRLVTLGLVLGAGMGYALTRAITSAFQGAVAPDPVSFVAVAVVLAAATVAAAAVPARRALALDPARVLRSE